MVRPEGEILQPAAEHAVALRDWTMPSGGRSGKFVNFFQQIS